MKSLLPKLLLPIFFLRLWVGSETIETFYGPIEVEEPVLIELIHAPALQRLKSIHQYGVAYYTTHPEEYNRFDHSLGVFAILKTKGASLEEQISGLLHDVSHTAFSHVGDWVFGKEYQEEDYQSTIHKLYLAVSGVEKILNRYGYTVEQILPKKAEFKMLEQPLPDLSADRIDYNIQGAYFQNFLTREEAQILFKDLFFENGRWLMTRKDLASKLMRFSLFMTEDCWGSAVNYVTSRWLADAILHGLKIGLISWNEFHFGVDQDIWDKLLTTQDPLIQKRMQMVTSPDAYYHFVEPSAASVLVKFRCRGIDPWIRQEGKIVRLTSIDPELAEAFKRTKEKSARGWPIEVSSKF
jgi:hypothetical protein